MSLSRYEQETIINFNVKEKKAFIYTADPTTMRKFDNLCEMYPEVYKQTFQDDTSKMYTAPKEYVTFRKPRKISEEQREILLENLKKIKNSKDCNVK